jgi:hypothetical protein
VAAATMAAPVDVAPGRPLKDEPPTEWPTVELGTNVPTPRT